MKYQNCSFCMSCFLQLLQVWANLMSSLGSLNTINMENPWDINSIYDLAFFCCPECGCKTQDKEVFVIHALNDHPRVSSIWNTITIGKSVFQACNCGIIFPIRSAHKDWELENASMHNLEVLQLSSRWHCCPFEK